MRDVKLNQYIQEVSKKYFVWGRCDCVLFGADWTNFFCGIDPAENYRGKYKTETGAKKLIIKDVKLITEVVDKYFERINPAYMQIGDVGLYNLSQGQTIGIYGGRNGSWFKTQDIGAIQLNELAEFAWRVE